MHIKLILSVLLFRLHQLYIFQTEVNFLLRLWCRKFCLYLKVLIGVGDAGNIAERRVADWDPVVNIRSDSDPVVNIRSNPDPVVNIRSDPVFRTRLDPVFRIRLDPVFNIRSEPLFNIKSDPD